MFINKTHSKKELMKIIETYDIDIKNANKYKKIELSFLLSKALEQLENINPHENYHFQNIVELKQHLSNINPSKLLSVKEKNNVILICKKIKHFCRNNYLINNTDYISIKALYRDANYIKDYGSIPSCRKCIKELNKYPDRPYKIDVVIPLQTQRELDLKDNLKQETNGYFKVKRGKVLIVFE